MGSLMTVGCGLFDPPVKSRKITIEVAPG